MPDSAFRCARIEPMSELILHHYPPSPVSEKIRLAMGLKDLAWRSVEQNRLPDRPELLAMTGGYRRIPVLQHGADIYCDTQVILDELEQRVPSPSLHPGGPGLAYGLSRWLDVEAFELGVRAAFAPVADTLPPALIADRTQLYFGPDGDMAREAADMPHTLAQLRAHLGWLEQRLAGGSGFLDAGQAGMTDLLAWYVFWFVRGRYVEAGSFLAEFPALGAWAERMERIGHGRPTDMTTAEALSAAKAVDPATAEAADALDPQGLVPGMAVDVAPMSRNDTEVAVSGTVRVVSRTRIAIARHDEACGDVVVHFPRVGYRVTRRD